MSMVTTQTVQNGQLKGSVMETVTGCKHSVERRAGDATLVVIVQTKINLGVQGVFVQCEVGDVDIKELYVI